MPLDSYQSRNLVSALEPLLWRFGWVWVGVAVASLSAVFTALLVRVAPGRGWVVIPGGNRWNQRVVAQFGGIPILMATSAIVPFMHVGGAVAELLFLTLGMALLGFIDDIIGLGPKPKLIVQVLFAIFAVNAGIVHPLSHFAIVNAAFTVFWIVGITNAFNLIDNIDGLAGGVAIIALAQILLLAGMKVPASTLALSLLASIVGFLFFNLNPAKVFMGDVGSLPIGFFLACASIMTASRLSSLGSLLLVPCLVLFIPIFDMLLVTITRRLNGRAISRGARDHTSHRLVLLGLTERQAVTILYAMALVAGVLGFCWERFWPDWGAGFLTLFLVGATLFWLYLAKLELPQSWLSESTVLVINLPAFFWRVAAKCSAFVLDAILVVLAFYFARLSNLAELGPFFLVQFWIASIAVLVTKLTFLVACGVYRERWSLTRARDTLAILKAIFLSTCFILVTWLVLPSHQRVPIKIILSDAGLSALLLLLTRTSTRLFDFALGRLRVSSPVQRQAGADSLAGFSQSDLKQESTHKLM